MLASTAVLDPNHECIPFHPRVQQFKGIAHGGIRGGLYRSGR